MQMKKHKTAKIIAMQLRKALIVIGLVFVMCSCTTYTPPMVQHTYITSTQSQHALTGLNISYRAGLETGSDVIGQIGFATMVKTQYFIDGRLVACHPPQKGLETFVQLPPGHHQLIVQGTSQGAITLGFKVSDYKLVYVFELSEGQIGTFIAKSVPGEYTSGYLPEGFENVSSWDEVQ